MQRVRVQFLSLLQRTVNELESLSESLVSNKNQYLILQSTRSGSLRMWREWRSIIELIVSVNKGNKGQNQTFSFCTFFHSVAFCKSNAAVREI